MISNLAISQREIGAFCRRWKVYELALFGSVLRDDFRLDSDVDVLVTFMPDTKVHFADLLRMEQELSALFGRRVDLGTRKSVEADPNYLRRKAILDTAQVIYAQR